MCVGTCYSFSVKRYTYIDTDLDIDNTATSTLSSQLRGSGSSGILPTACIQPVLYQPGLLGETAALGALMGKGQFETEHLFVPKDKEVLKEWWGHVKS